MSWEQMKAQSRKAHSRSTPELRVVRVDYNPAFDAQDRLRRLFTMLLRHTSREDLLDGVRDHWQADCEESKN